MQNDESRISSLESYVSADLPIKAKKDDRLNRVAFSEALARVIRGWRKKPSLVIGLFGEWGSGKSSIKNMVLESLNSENADAFPIVEFSPWQVSGQELLTETFFREIGNALGKTASSDDTVVKNRVARWKVYAACLSMAATVARTWKAAMNPAHPSIFQPVAAISSTALASAASVVKTGAEGIESEGVLDTMSLAELKASVSEDLSQLETPILVILDDVDRLTKEEIRLTLQLVKANADFPNLIYLILAQKETVVKALDEIAPERGDIFLEKIVQVAFDVPNANRKQVQELLLNGLNDLLAHPSLTSRFSRQYWSEVFPEIFPLFRNLRDVNRFLGSLAFHIGLFRNGSTFEVNPVDLIALETLRIFENNLYKRLAGEKEILTYEARWFRENKRDEDKARFEALVNTASADRRPGIKKILVKVFPPTDTETMFLRSGSSIDAAEQRWFKQLRVCSYQTFDRYFQFETPEGDVSQADIDEVTTHMADQKELGCIFDRLVQRDLLDVMLVRLHTLKETLSLDHASTFLAALYEIKPIHRLYSFLEPSPEKNITGITYWYLQRLSESDRLQVLLDALAKTTGIGFAARGIAVFVSDPREGGGSAPLLSSESDRKALKTSLLHRIAEVTAEQFEIEPQDFRMLRIWAAWEPENTRNWLLAYIATRPRLVRFLAAAVHLSGEAPKTKRYISLEVIDPMLSRDELQARIDELLDTELNEQEIELVGMIEAAKKRGPFGPGIDPFDEDSDE